MYKTKIDWCDSSWNPVTGCFHGCAYCYARGIANRFGLEYAPVLGDPGMEGACKYDSQEGMDTMLSLAKPYRKDGKANPYPMAFAPTFHRYRLNDPAKWSEPRNIFVCSMADLFGRWVPQEWQQEVLRACLDAPQHRYLFLTKAPNHVCQWPRFKGDKDYLDFDCDREKKGAIRDNIWMGVSFSGLQDDIPNLNEYPVDSFSDVRARYLDRLLVHSHGHKFISIEPIQCDVTELHREVVDGFTRKAFKEYWFQDRARHYEWIIVGAETGKRKGRIVPERAWIERLASFCKNSGIPIFMKESIREIMGDGFRQEFPWKA